MPLHHATKDVFPAVSRETGLNTVTPSRLQSNHTWPQPDCRKAQGSDFECCWLQWTCSWRQNSCSLLTPITSGLHTLSSHTALFRFGERGRNSKRFFFFILDEQFSLISSHFSPLLEAAQICVWLGTRQWPPAAVPVTGALTPEPQHLHCSRFSMLCAAAPWDTQGSLLVKVFFSFIDLFYVTLQLNQFFQSAHATRQRELRQCSRGGQQSQEQEDIEEEPAIRDRVRKQVAVTNASTITTKYFFPGNHKFRQRNKTFT